MRKLLAGVAIGLGAAGLVFLIAWPGWLEVAELKTYDWRTRMMASIRVAQGQPLVHPDIVLVEITDASIRDLSEFVGRWPWPRALQGMIVDYISSGKPKVIAIDLTLLEPERTSKYQFPGRGEITSAQSDQDLADAARRAGNVIMLADAVDAGLDNGELIQKDWTAPPYRLGPAIEERPVVTLPYPALTAAAAGLGHNFIALDPDGPGPPLPAVYPARRSLHAAPRRRGCAGGRCLSTGGSRARRRCDSRQGSSDSARPGQGHRSDGPGQDATISRPC